MKLTEVKLKQMILEMMSQSEKYYNKLKSLLNTEEGYLQADSLFEVMRDQLDTTHQMYMENLLKPLRLGKEVRQQQQMYFEAIRQHKEVYNSFDDPDKASQQQIDEYIRTEEIMNSALKAFSDTYKSLRNHLSSMTKAGIEKEIVEVAESISQKAIRGEL